jgi:hypothetical protein
LVVSLVLGLFYYWFAIANRYVIFLYGHLGAGPFDASTSSRYWMAGLVSAGALFCAYAFMGWCCMHLATVFYQPYSLPSWQHVWLLSASPVAIGIWIITTRCNYPVLPLQLAGRCVITALGGRALALWLAEQVVLRTSETAWIILHGAGLMPILLLLRAIGLPSRDLTVSRATFSMSSLGLITGIMWVMGAAWLRTVQRKSALAASEIFYAGLTLSYVILPFIHYLLLTPPDTHYITTASNFFASVPAVQLLSWGISALVALIATRCFDQKRQ